MQTGFYEALFLDHPDPMWIYDTATLRFLAVNQAAIDKYGYSREEFLALTLLDIRPPEELARLQQALATYAGRAAGTGIWRHRSKTGQLLYVDIRTRPVEFEGHAAKLVCARDVSGQVALEQERQELFRNVRRLVQLGTWQLQLDSGALSWSEDIYGIFGVSPEAFGHSFEAFLALVHPDDVPLLVATQEAAIRNGVPFDIEHRVCRPDGSLRIVREVGEVVATVQGRILRGVVQDITAQRETELRLAATLESMTDAFCTLDREWRFRFINGEFTRILGVGRQQLLGRNVWQCFPSAQGTSFQHNLEHAIHSGVAVGFVEYLEGYDKWLRVKAYPGPDGLAVYLQDVTQERQQEQAARINEERLHYIAKAAFDSIWDWDLGTDQIWWSASYTALTGHDPQALGSSSREWSRFVHPEDRQRVVEGLKAVLAGTHSSWRDEYRYICADSRVLTVMDRGFVIRDAQGRPLRMVGSMVDVTENRALAQQLQQAQKLESIGQLTGGVAHDFNNLLTVVMGNAEVLEEELTDQPRLQPLAAMITRAAQRGSELTNRLLAFARRQVLAPQRVDLARLLDGMHGLLRRVLAEDIEIELRPAPALWPVEVDPGQLEVALLNLAINARDAMPGGGRLSIRAANVELDGDAGRDNAAARPGAYVLLSVTDTGSGMPPEVLARAFEPFFTTKEPGKGSGLGLSMVYGFVQQSGGLARISTEPGVGTTVSLYFPRAATNS